METSTRRVTQMALYVSMALVLSLIERMLPIPTPIPGVKLGLPNLIILIVLFKHGFKDALLVSVSRVFLAAIFGGGLSALLYSMSGALLSLFAMSIVIYLLKERVSAIGVGFAGAYFHSFGQVLMAAVILQNIGMLSYLPIMMWASLVTGALIGITANAFLSRTFEWI